MNELLGHIVLPDRVMPGRLLFGRYIEAIEPKNEVPDFIILPGILDWHVHGGGGGDVMDGESGIRALAATHARFGLTGFLATTVTADDDEIDQVIDSVRKVMATPDPNSAQCFGIHLEGPFLSKAKLGAQPSKTREVAKASLERWFKSGLVRVMSYAPEQDISEIVPEIAKNNGVKIQIGHTGCAYHRARNLLSLGCGVTHLFNAMSGIHHRAASVALAALNYADYSEIICDGVHVEEPAFQLARKSIPSLYSVTDGTAASGMPDGVYHLGGQKVIKANNSVRLQDGTLAGSAATAEQTVQTLRSYGLKWPEIAEFTAMRPARWLDLKPLGIYPGHLANFTVFKDLVCHQTWIEGRLIHSYDAAEKYLNTS